MESLYVIIPFGAAVSYKSEVRILCILSCPACAVDFTFTRFENITKEVKELCLDRQSPFFIPLPSNCPIQLLSLNLGSLV